MSFETNAVFSERSRSPLITVIVDFCASCVNFTVYSRLAGAHPRTFSVFPETFKDSEEGEGLHLIGIPLTSSGRYKVGGDPQSMIPRTSHKGPASQSRRRYSYRTLQTSALLPQQKMPSM